MWWLTRPTERQRIGRSKTVRNVTTKFAFIGVLALSACGPMYDTQYTLTPPKNESGRMCVFQCQTSQSQCEELESMRNERCEERAEREYQQCQWRVQLRERRDPKWYECSKDSCSSDTQRCLTQFHRCYQACGGTVKAETVCVANCDQIPARNAPPPSGTTKEDYRRY